MEAPTSLWESYLEKGTSGTAVSKTFMQDKILPDLRSLGYLVPTRGDLESILCYGVDPLPWVNTANKAQHGESVVCSFQHFLNLLWHPLIEQVEYLDKDPDHQRQGNLDLHQKALVTEMAGVVPSPEKHMDMEAWVEHIQHTLLRILEVHVLRLLL